MKLLLFIGARSGSKGVKGKNARLLNGKPLIAHTIEVAQAWGKADRVIVSTDGEALAEIARQYGAEVPFLRPNELATDEASKVLAIRHALVKCEEIYQERYDAVMDLDVTAPIRKVEDLDKCLQIFEEHRPKTVFSVVRAHKNPYFNMVEEKDDGSIGVVIPPKKPIHRRQDAKPVYAINGSIYIYRRDHLLENEDPTPFSDSTKIYVMDDIAGTDIDREIDFLFIEFLLENADLLSEGS